MQGLYWFFAPAWQSDPTGIRGPLPPRYAYKTPSRKVQDWFAFLRTILSAPIQPIGRVGEWCPSETHPTKKRLFNIISIIAPILPCRGTVCQGKTPCFTILCGFQRSKPRILADLNCQICYFIAILLPSFIVHLIKHTHGII